ncbi:anthrax toxin-like adenylyl cyclase domain-containing protein [Spartinivicinus poritis]|uniref:Anthrax toxin-like adenylyl cyclase domain-containing protein n=1 Tax=Spartinivicinus poritis TaxID=2994640 RepID=A0ABT5UDP8_9GAMM|nr:anthrax toxin-like adenylyl cyclase domain-containing protein [Spartinivicinus sp. A2-2]MDE1464131.1 anthrax toxin-like adenylyl cyclase domain-containing protein [Spartinivicinus sp. A2-2]
MFNTILIIIFMTQITHKLSDTSSKIVSTEQIQQAAIGNIYKGYELTLEQNNSAKQFFVDKTNNINAHELKSQDTSNRKLSLPVLFQNKTKLLFSQAIQDVVNTVNTVLAIRAPNIHSIGLLLEGYASKNFLNKAKSSNGGPTAGFVVDNPKLSKVRCHGEKALKKQQSLINDAINEGAKRIQLELSNERVEYLVEEKLIEIISHNGSTPIIKGFYGENDHEYFQLQKTEDNTWALFHLPDFKSLENPGKSTPVRGLTNPPVPGVTEPVGAKAAVTADYDLFGIWPTINQSNNKRPLNTVPRPLRGQVASNYVKHLEQQGTTIKKDSTIEADPIVKEDQYMGNIHTYGKHIIKQLNQAIQLAGYQGGHLFHHNDESGNPFSPGQDYPIVIFIPKHQQPYLVSNDEELQAAYKLLETRGFYVEKNPAFMFKHSDTLHE